MMPFRLTRQIEGVLAPSGINGTLKSAMVYCLNALKNKADTIIDYCDIFIKDPLLDWVKIAKSKTSGSQYLEGTTEFVDISWYPLKKMEIVKKKLSSANPRDIYEEALQETRHYKEGYYNTILAAIKGEHGTYRSRFIDTSLTTEQQVEFLLDQARDPAILGRTWIGWAPQV
jgi:DNA-dependent protein kinase catalytic subunit